MRFLCCLILLGATMVSVAPVTAQRYDPRYPVCLERWEWGGSVYYDCGFTNWDQCRAAASGLDATCLNNPYWSNAREQPPGRFSRRPRGGY